MRRYGSWVRWALTALTLVIFLARLGLAQTQNLPPKPPGYFTDSAGIVDAASGQAINEQLAQFERDTSNQLLVVIYPKLPDQAAADQYSIDTFNSWHPGQAGKDNGAVLFVYANDHKMFIVTGRGLEGSLPDATCKRIVRDEITPAFRQGNYTAGIQAGVDAMIAATKGEYKGSGETDQEAKQQNSGDGGGIPFWVIVLFVILIFVSRFFFSGFGGMPMIYTGGGWGGGGGFGGGGGGGGGFSGFSGGGGSSAGGGAGGSW